jgi:CDP-diglyceride synthetase
MSLLENIHTKLTFPRWKVSFIFYICILLTYYLYSPLIFVSSITFISVIEILFQIYKDNNTLILSLILLFILLFINMTCCFYCIIEYMESSSLYYFGNIALENLLRDICLVNSMSDGLQYVGGKLFGKHLAHPSISPSKTIEGYIFSYIISICIWPYLLYPNYEYNIIGRSVILGFIGGIISSITKRQLKIKNWSPLLGSHGGFTDRTDSLTLTIFLFLVFYDY